MQQETNIFHDDSFNSWSDFPEEVSCQHKAWSLMPALPPVVLRQTFDSCFDRRQARLLLGAVCLQDEILLLELCYCLLLLVDGIQEHNIEPIVFNALDLALLVSRNQEWLDLIDLFGNQPDVILSASLPTKTDGPEFAHYVQPRAQRHYVILEANTGDAIRDDIVVVQAESRAARAQWVESIESDRTEHGEPSISIVDDAGVEILRRSDGAEVEIDVGRTSPCEAGSAA